MAIILVNTTNTEYVRITNNKGIIGIGTPFETFSGNNYEIQVTQKSLEERLLNLRNLQILWESKTVQQLNNIKQLYDQSNNSAVMRKFKETLRDALYTTNVPPSVAGNNVYTFFPYTSTQFNTVDNVRDYCVGITSEWIELFENILNKQTGLTRTEEDVISTVLDESSRVEDQFFTIQLDIQNVEISLTDALLKSTKELITSKTLQFFDENREYKTVLNFGLDNQYLLESWRRMPSDTSSIQLKLLESLDNNLDINSRSYIVREFANTIIDTVTIELPPEQDTTLSLRPKNMDVGKFSVNKQSLDNVTLDTLKLLTGSIGNISASTISYDDRVFNRWFTSDFNSSELNIDFSDYNNFVFFGSAKARLDAFVNKLSKIQSYGANISLSSSNDGERRLALEKEYIKRNFDTYEQYLYFATESLAYSASVYYVDSGTEYNSTGSWPKQNGTPIPVASAQNWYSIQSAIAERFDEYNSNYLVKHLPIHIQEDVNSADFIKFIQMFGHIMDNIKVYIDQMPNIYSTNPDPFDELSMDQVYEVAKSFGMNLPNAYSLEALQSFIATLYDGTGARSFVAETWKRFLHSSIYLRKLKGSRTGIDAIVNTYGLNSPLVQLKESSYATQENYIKSDELVYGLQYTGSVSSSIRIPFVSASYSASSLQLRFIPELRKQSTLLSTNNTWAIDLVPHPSSSTDIKFNTSDVNNKISYFTLTPPTVKYGKINIVSGSNRTVIASSSYFPLFDDIYTNILLRSQSQDFIIIQTDGSQILYQESSSVNLGTLWNNNFIYLGGTGSIKVSNFDGIIDEVRLWGENTTDDNFVKQAYDPGSYYGLNYSSSYNSLYVDISFSQPFVNITSSAVNESPFYGVSNLSNLPAFGFTTESYVRILRTIKQFTPVVGSDAFSNNKVTVASAPIFKEEHVDDNGVKILRTYDSIKPAKEKQYTSGQDYVQFAVAPTDFINQNIIRSMGDIDTNYLIGSPRKYKDGRYTELDDVLNFYLEKYNDAVDINQYIRFFKNILKGPTEYIESYVPARTRLVQGIVIESPILDRYKTYIQKSIKVDGSNTQTFDEFVAGSGSYTASINQDAGAYDFVAEYPREEEIDTTVLTNPTPILQQIGQQIVTSSLISTNGGIGFVDADIDNTMLGPVSSTPMEDLEPNKIMIQTIGKSLVSSSLADRNSGIGFIDSDLDAQARNQVTQSGYMRNPYLGLNYLNSQIPRIKSELNTLDPFYEIKPTSDFSDVGTTTYFYNSTGIYWFPEASKERLYAQFSKKLYRAKLNVPIGEIDSNLAREFSKITLLNPDRLTDYPGERGTLKLTNRTYSPGEPYKGVLNIQNIISLFSVTGTTGLRLRLYRKLSDQEADLSRSIYVTPSINSGVLLDTLLDSDPIIFPYTLLRTDDSTMYFTVDNTTLSSITSEISMIYFKYEPANLTPSGYLNRHYRFSRTKNTADLRRNYLGCRLVYCPEGCPPDVTGIVESDNPVMLIFAQKTRKGPGEPVDT